MIGRGRQSIVGFEFGGYELWPSELTVYEAVIPQDVRLRQRAEFTIGSLNMFRLFDDIDDPIDATTGRERNDFVVSTAEYERRRVKFVGYILNVLDAPDILGVQEVEKLEVLEMLAADIALADPTVTYSAYLEEGNDVGTIDVGFLVRDTVAVDSVTQVGKAEILAFDGSLLHDRPPLLIEAQSVNDGADFPFAVMVVHNRSLNNIDSPTDGDRVRAKRLAQAQSIATKVQELQTADPDIRLVVVGDFNAFEFSDGYVDALGQIAVGLGPNHDGHPGFLELDLGPPVEPVEFLLLAGVEFEVRAEQRFQVDGAHQFLNHVVGHAVELFCRRIFRIRSPFVIVYFIPVQGHQEFRIAMDLVLPDRHCALHEMVLRRNQRVPGELRPGVVFLDLRV